MLQAKLHPPDPTTKLPCPENANSSRWQRQPSLYPCFSSQPTGSRTTQKLRKKGGRISCRTNGRHPTARSMAMSRLPNVAGFDTLCGDALLDHLPPILALQNEYSSKPPMVISLGNSFVHTISQQLTTAVSILTPSAQSSSSPHLVLRTLGSKWSWPGGSKVAQQTNSYLFPASNRSNGNRKPTAASRV